MQTFDDDYDPSLYWFPLDGVRRKVRALLRLTYRSTSAQVTERDFDVEAFERGQDGFVMYGYCRLRKAQRTLSSRSAAMVIDRNSQKVIPDLREFLEDKYRKMPDYPYDLLLDMHGWAIAIIVYFAAADGAVRQAERKVIQRFILGLPNFAELNVEKIEALLRDIGRSSKTDFHRLVRDNATVDPEFLMEIIRRSEEVMSTIKTPHSEQVRALAYIKRQWKDVISAAQISSAKHLIL